MFLDLREGISRNLFIQGPDPEERANVSPEPREDLARGFLSELAASGEPENS